MPDLPKLSTTHHHYGSMKDSLNNNIASETSPLLPAAVQGPPRNDETDQSLLPRQAHVRIFPGERDEDDDDAKPLPKFQIALLCFARVAEPVRTLLLAL